MMSTIRDMVDTCTPSLDAKPPSRIGPASASTARAVSRVGVSSPRPPPAFPASLPACFPAWASSCTATPRRPGRSGVASASLIATVQYLRYTN